MAAQCETDDWQQFCRCTICKADQGPHKRNILWTSLSVSAALIKFTNLEKFRLMMPYQYECVCFLFINSCVWGCGIELLQFWDKLQNSLNSGCVCLNSSSWLLFCSFLKQQFLLGEAAMMYLEPEYASVWPSQCRCYWVLAPPVIVAGTRMEYLIHTSVTSVFLCTSNLLKTFAQISTFTMYISSIATVNYAYQF